MKRLYVGLITIALFAITSKPALCDSIIGFRTDSLNNYSISYDGNQTTISFGETIINNASYNGTLAGTLLNANVNIADIIIDLNSKIVIAQFGPYQYAQYDLLPYTPIASGFQITVGDDVVLSADLLLSSARFILKSGSIDPAVALNVSNVTINTSALTDPVAIALLMDFVYGGDLNIIVEDTSATDIVAEIDNRTLITGIFAGTFSSIRGTIIPEPITLLLTGMAFAVSFLARRKKN